MASVDRTTKDAALELFRKARADKQQQQGGNKELAEGSRLYAPPAQSRDASGSTNGVNSRYFPASGSHPGNLGNVLVPSSSPLGPSTTPSAHAVRDVAPFDGFQTDLFSSNYHHYETSNLGRRPWDSPELYNEGPPRKRLNLGTHSPVLDLTSSPDSPQVRRPMNKRRIADVDDAESEDDLPETMTLASAAGSSKSRLTRDRPPAAVPSGQPQDAGIAFTRFRLTQPLEPPARIEAAWSVAGGDVKRATALLQDATWVPPSPKPVKTTPTRPENVGRVAEVDEASRRDRLATKAKGQQSAIYANRHLRSYPSEDTQPKATSSRFYNSVGPGRKKDSRDSSQAPSRAVSPAPAASRQRLTRKMIIDSGSDGGYSDGGDEEEEADDAADRAKALEYFNSSGADALQELTGCTMEQATKIISLRPFEDEDDLETKLKQIRKKAGFSSKLFDEAVKVFAGYGSVDSVLDECEAVGTSLQTAISAWTSSSDGEDGALTLRSMRPSTESVGDDYLSIQPALLADGIHLKEYQLLGVNWLNLLHTRQTSCILADEMGLGKTIQVISFFAHLKAQGRKGPHLVVVPSSTLENWCREFQRFVPSISVQTYYANKDERPELRQTLNDTMRSKSSTDEGWEVLITTYNLAQGDDRDRKFFRKIDWDCCVYDEGHVLKNFASQRYQALMQYGSHWRLLLTGTPLQNNLQELVSLLNFILPDLFSSEMGSLRAIFKVKGDAKVSLLSQQRISRAKKMMTPFVLRRRKDQVLGDLPNKTERIEWCDMADLQKSIYTDALKRSRKFVLETADPSSREGSEPPAPKKKKTKAKPAATKKTYLENSSNVLMDLRKSALHPMLFRRQFTDEILTSMAKQLLKEPDFKKRGALFELVKEDMQVMTDSELQYFCGTYKSIQKYSRDEACYLNSGKVETLLRLLAQFKQERRKVLIFSQFTQMLDILQAVLKQKEIEFLILTGSTPVDVRQSLVDEFSERDELDVFLLSTKAGGMGINLVAASVVIMFDQDFNPHNDKQAQDRAYRIGQVRDVDVIRLISRGTIEEDMLRLGEMKLALDNAVAGAAEENQDGDGAHEREMKKSLLETLRQQFTEEDAMEVVS
ncbi:SNF2 family DNA-dependent ATPase [Mycena kentingensis (nom. inval.)]|nr:SNF2 family DNA-dependent ATPase [Mycena kentingensis (nom. inval.)]